VCQLSLASLARASPETLTVTTTADQGLADNPEYCGGEGPGGAECPLRAALETAREAVSVGASEIVVFAPAGEYRLSKGALMLGNATKACEAKACPVTLRGAGAGRTVIDGQNSTTIVSVSAEQAPVTIAGVTLTHGYSEFGGAIDDVGTTMTVREAVLTANTATSLGGALFASGKGTTTTVLDSAIDGNAAGDGGGGITAYSAAVVVRRSSLTHNKGDYGGGLEVLSKFSEGVVVDSTIAENTAIEGGGGVYAPGREVAVHYSTIAGNKAGSIGGGIFGGDVVLDGSIVAANAPDACERPEAENGATTGANILSGASSCVFTGPAPSGADPKLGGLSANGGLGATLPLLRGSAALDAGGASCSGAEGSDQRGVARPLGAGCDLGALESAADAAVTLSAAPDPTVVGGSLTLMVKVGDAGADTLTGVSLTVPVPAGASLVSAPAGCIAVFGGTTTVTCALGSIAPGGSDTVPVVVRPELAGALVETASVVADQADYNPANDTATIASIATAAAPGPGPSGSPPPAVALAGGVSALMGRAFSFDRHGNLVVRVSCPANASSSCVDALALYARPGTLPALLAGRRATKLSGTARATIAPGRTLAVRLRLNGPGLKLARGRHSVALRLLLSSRRSAADTVSHTYTITLKPVALRRA
jgi:hypothetical protein